GAFGVGSCQRLAGENLAGSGCRCCPRAGARCLQRFPCTLERRRPRHSHPEASQGGVREIAMTRPTSVLTAGVSLILGWLSGNLSGLLTISNCRPSALL